MTESECGAFFAQSERILLRIEQWLGEGATVRKTIERVNRFLSAPYSPAAFETVKLLPVDLFAGESIRDRLRELDADVRQWQELAKIGRTLEEWENANAGSLRDYGTAGAPTVASMLGYACHDLNEALSELEELYRRGGYANHGFRLSPEWKTAFIAWKGAEWLEKALINASIVDGLFRDPQRFRLAEWDRETLQKALHHEWIRARANAQSATPALPPLDRMASHSGGLRDAIQSLLAAVADHEPIGSACRRVRKLCMSLSGSWPLFTGGDATKVELAIDALERNYQPGEPLPDPGRSAVGDLEQWQETLRLRERYGIAEIPDRPQPDPARPDRIEDGLSKDGSALRWGGVEYPLTPTQRRVVGLLWEAWQRGRPWLTESFLRTEAECSDLRKVLRKGRDLISAGIVGKNPKSRDQWGLTIPKQGST